VQWRKGAKAQRQQIIKLYCFTVGPLRRWAVEPLSR